MMWVKLTLPPRVRIRWLLRILRLTSRSRAGTCRKLVAVGTVSDCSMFCTTLAAAPRRGTARRSEVVPFPAPSPAVAGLAATGAVGAVVAGEGGDDADADEG